MKKRDKKKMVYDAMVLRLAVALEWFLNHNLETRGFELCGSMPDKAKVLCGYFKANRVVANEIESAVLRVNRTRNQVAHSRGGYLPRLDTRKFLDIRKDCVTIDKLFQGISGTQPGISPMSKIMFHSLPYHMGNAGDLIKHGALAHYVGWWFGQNTTARPLRFVDPFGGCPWEEVENTEIKRRLNALGEQSQRAVALCLWDRECYYNSGHIVAEAANRCAGKAVIRTSDESDIARSDLMVSSLRRDDMLLFEDDPDFQDIATKSANGFAILNSSALKTADLVLFDPFGGFLRNEFISKQESDRAETFNKIVKAVADNEKLCVMIFLLDMWSKDRHTGTIADIHHRYVDDYRPRLSECAISLRCPKIPDRYGIKGESDYEAEILLVSQMFANGGGDKLRARLEKFASTVQGILPLGGNKIELWPK